MQGREGTSIETKTLADVHSGFVHTDSPKTWWEMFVLG